MFGAGPEPDETGAARADSTVRDGAAPPIGGSEVCGSAPAFFAFLTKLSLIAFASSMKTATSQGV